MTPETHYKPCASARRAAAAAKRVCSRSSRALSRASHQGRSVSRVAFSLFVSFALVVGTFPSIAYADDTTSSDVDASPENLSTLQKQVEASANEYNTAMDKLESLQAQMEENQQRIDEINEQLPEQEERSADAFRVLYILQQESSGLIEMVLNSEDFNDFIRNIDYLDCLHDHNVNELSKLTSLKEELEATQAELEDQTEQAESEASRAERALAQAQAARQEAQEKAEAIAAQQAAEAAAAAAAAESSDSSSNEAGVDAQNPSVDTSEQDTSGNVSGSVSSGSVDWSADKTSFVNQWASRIDAYLAGSPLAGQGTVFAEAAWDYGVDPRWSPAISYVESSMGAHCFRSYNAWGWGSSSWGSWEEAIRAHVSGLARIYGSTLTYDAARKYCPPNSTGWYNNVLAQMESI